MYCNIWKEDEPKMIIISKVLLNEQRQKYVQMMKEFYEVFSWSYADLKMYDTSIMHNKIPFMPDTKPIKQKLGHLNHVLFPSIEKEMRNIWDAKIIIPLRFSNWVANIVHVGKKNSKIRICVEFRNLNKTSLKDNYMFPKMDHIL